MSSYIRILERLDNDGAKFAIDGDIGNNTKLLIPDKLNGLKLEFLEYISKDIKDKVEEIVFPKYLYGIANNELIGLNKIIDVTFKKDIRLDIKELPNLEVVRVDRLHDKQKLLMAFHRLPKLTTIELKEKPISYHKNTVVECESLYVQSLIHDNLLYLVGDTFIRTADQVIDLPKSTTHININFISNKDKRVRVNISNINAYLSTKSTISRSIYKTTVIEIHGLTIVPKDLDKKGIKLLYKNEVYRTINNKKLNDIVILEPLKLEEEKKILKAKALGVSLAKNGLNKTLYSSKMSLILTDEEHVKETLRKAIKDIVYHGFNKNILISNGYTSIAYDIDRLSMYMIGKRNGKSKLYELENTMLIACNESILIYCISKQHILNNIEEYFSSENKSVYIKPIAFLRIENNEIDTIEEDGNRVIIRYKDGEVEGVDFGG